MRRRSSSKAPSLHHTYTTIQTRQAIASHALKSFSDRRPLDINMLSRYKMRSCQLCADLNTRANTIHSRRRLYRQNAVFCHSKLSQLAFDRHLHLLKYFFDPLLRSLLLHKSTSHLQTHPSMLFPLHRRHLAHSFSSDLTLPVST